MIDKRRARKYCYQDISLIENYDKAVADKENVWHCHHRVETIMNCGSKELIAVGAYYDRPARELIFLTKGEHRRLHRQGTKSSKETRRKISEAKKGMKLSEEAIKKMAKAKKGKPRSEETRRKISEAHKGMKLSNETKMKISELKKGKKRPPFTDETRRKISEARKLYWERRRTGQCR